MAVCISMLQGQVGILELHWEFWWKKKKISFLFFTHGFLLRVGAWMHRVKISITRRFDRSFGCL